MIRTKQVQLTDTTVTHYDTGTVDTKGRKEGVCVRTDMVEFVPIAEGEQVHSYYTREPGVYYALHMQKTKDGRDFGATQSWKFFETEAERTAAIKKRTGR